MTGASRGIGDDVAMELAREEMNLCPAARELAKLQQIAIELTNESDLDIHVLSADLCDSTALGEIAGDAVAWFNSLDLLVNKPIETKWLDFFTLSEKHWQDGFALKFQGQARMTCAPWPRPRQSNGSIVNSVGIGLLSSVGAFAADKSDNVALLNGTEAMADIGIAQGYPGQCNRSRIDTD